MKIERRSLSDALSLLKKVVDPRQTVPVLGNIMVEPKLTGITLTGTDLETHVVLDVAAGDVDFTVPFLVNPATLLALVKAQPKGVKEIAVRLETEMQERVVPVEEGQTESPNTIQVEVPVKLRVNSATVPILSIDEFPVVPTVVGEPLHIPGLTKAIERVAIAVSHDENRYALNGIYFEPGERFGDPTHVVATDGHRLFLATLPPTTLPKGLIARSTFQALLDAKKMDPTDRILITDCQVVLPLSHGRIIGRLIEGQFPNYQAILPKKFARTAVAPKEALREAVVAVASVAESRTKPIILSLNGAVILSASSVDNGSAQATVADATYIGPEGKIGMNARYLLDMIDAVEADTITIGFGENMELTPFLIADHGFTAVTMPMRV